ncbi:MAG: AraC family transcriptional regulator [Maledivibacter sp.]|nr:AraC family transcriptional regulator [Maledivibacter sp.]
MKWLSRLTNALDYIEENIEGKIDIYEVAKISYSSPSHFQRMFYMIMDVTIAEYIRKRKLTLAAQELATSRAKVIDIAFKYGYETPEAFSKAFKNLHGIPPSAARRPGIKLKAYPRLSFQISIKGDENMDYKIIDKDAYKLIGKSIRVSTKDGENYIRIPKFWEEFNRKGLNNRIMELTEKKDMLGICTDYCEDLQELTYIIAVEKTKDVELGEFEEFEIPPSTWAVFQSIGSIPDAIQRVWKRIYSEWFPATGYEHSGGPEMELYPNEGLSPNDDDYRCEVWIPIIKD